MNVEVQGKLLIYFTHTSNHRTTKIEQFSSLKKIHSRPTLSPHFLSPITMCELKSHNI